MRNAYDFRLTEDRLQVGRDLAPLIEDFRQDGQRKVPLGRAWNALGELLGNLRELAFERFREGQKGNVARLLAALGLPMARPAAQERSEIARLEGYQQALHDLQREIAAYVATAREADSEPARGQANGRRFGGEPRIQPGRSPM